MQKKLVLLTLLTSSVLASESEVLSIDNAVASNLQLAFPNDKKITANPSDFQLLNFVSMSNESGERWAVVTLFNQANGARMLEQNHLMALFANGKRRAPTEFNLHFKAKETQSITVSFGESKFPILAVTTEPET